MSGFDPEKSRSWICINVEAFFKLSIMSPTMFRLSAKSVQYSFKVCKYHFTPQSERSYRGKTTMIIT